ncbi:MAG: TonB-dependent receptor plug domain-containing protein, partial [Cellvibrionaceae bacterium]|nr:TonB-dependent receptor plug domain-containing protein [Cellvibrionaceae bacterium]
MKKLNKQLLPACSALALCGAAGLFATPVYAQEALQTETVEAQAATDEQAVKKKVRAIDEEIVVTGSRIRRDEFTSTAPIQVITTNKSALAGLISATDILQGSSLASGQQVNDTFSGFVTDGGPGAKQISLRGLGGQRSLVLVNGKRWGPSGVRGQVASV